MKLETILITLAALLPASAPLLAPVLRQAQAASQDPHQKAYDDFDKSFKQLLAVNDAQGMADLVRKSPDVAVRYVDDHCQLLAKGSTDELEKLIAALRSAWKASMQTSFVDKIYEYHSLMDSRVRNERQRMIDAYGKSAASFDENLAGAKKGSAFDTSAEEFTAIAEGFAAVGDLLNVGRSWSYVALCMDEGVRGKDANLFRACAAHKKSLEAFEAIGRAGPQMEELRSRYEFLKAGGFDKPEPAMAGAGGTGPDAAGPAPGQPASIVESGPALALALAFETVDDPERYARPNFYSDSVYQAWPYLLLKKGEPGKLDTQPESGVTLEFLGGVQVALNDTSGTKAKPTTASGNVDVLTGTLKDKHGERPWALATRIGTTQDTYQGRQIYLAPGDEYMFLFFSGAASMVGLLGETPLRVFDDNLDGVYGSPITYHSNWGLASGNFQPNFDTLVVGKGTRAIPWSQLVQVDGAWHKLEPAGGGSTLKATPVTVETGTLRLDYKGQAPSWLIVKGAGEFAECYFDVCQSPKGVAVPVGDYELVAGLIQQGKKQQMMKCLVLGGATVGKWTVTAGKETVMQLGAPLRFDFELQRNGDKGVVKGASVRVIGSAGENYDRFWNCAPAPSVSTRKAGTKKGGKPEEMPRVMGDLNERNDDNTPRWSFGDVWRPLDLEVELKRGNDAMEVQITEKKHKLLGSAIESDWK
jgi:hypothetical protein